MSVKSKIIQEMSEFLSTLNCAWSIDQGKKHHKIKVNGHLVGVLPITGRGDGSQAGRRALLNIKSQARKTAASEDDCPARQVSGVTG